MRRQMRQGCLVQTGRPGLKTLPPQTETIMDSLKIEESDRAPEIEQSRLQLCAYSASILDKGLDLLGIETMEKM